MSVNRLHAQPFDAAFIEKPDLGVLTSGGRLATFSGCLGIGTASVTRPGIILPLPVRKRRNGVFHSRT